MTSLNCENIQIVFNKFCLFALTLELIRAVRLHPTLSKDVRSLRLAEPRPEAAVKAFGMKNAFFHINSSVVKGDTMAIEYNTVSWRLYN